MHGSFGFWHDNAFMKMSWPILLQFAVLIIVWGFTWPISKIALENSPPILFAALRIFLSGLILFMWQGLRTHKWLGTHVWLNVMLSVFNCSLFYALQTVALSHLSAGLLSILVYTQPIFTVIMARLWLNEGLSVPKIVGVFLGFLGVIAISMQGLVNVTQGISVIWGLGAGLSWATGTVAYKKYSLGTDPAHDMAIQLTIGGVTLLVLGSIMEPWAWVHWTKSFIVSWLFTATLGTSLAWWLWAKLLKVGEASRVATWTFLVPVLATVLSVFWLHERATVWLVLGGGAVLISTYLVNRRSFSAGVAHDTPRKRAHFR